MTRAAFAFGAKGQSPLSAVAVFAILADMFDRHHMLIVRRIEHANALGSAAGDADAFHRHSDQLPAIAHQHDLIRHFDRESSHEMADLAEFGRIGSADTLAAAS